MLHSFEAPPRGANPWSGVIRDPAGNLYGTTAGGGAADMGVVYKLGANGHETVLCSFTGGSDGKYPEASVILDPAGNLYGTTVYGGTANAGVVYKVGTRGDETVLYSFSGGADGANPHAGLVRDSAGNLYGTTTYGGTAGAGTVFKLNATGNYAVLYSFSGGADGGYPNAGVIRDSAGNLYGTTSGGGRGGAGAVFKVNRAGHETVLYGFTGGADGSSPVGGVIRDPAGNLYGTTAQGGTAYMGVVYKVDTAGHETVLYSFAGGADGGVPMADVVRDSAGNLYGTTFQGGTAGWGAVFKLGLSGDQTVLHSFTGGADGGEPLAGVIRDPAGNLYGTAQLGGTAGLGVAYKVDGTGDETVLYSFPWGADGYRPSAGVIGDPAGNLYGTTSYGGTGGHGVVYKLDPAGHETVLYGFTGGADGGGPSGGVIRDSAGNLYGTTTYGGPAGAGVIFKLDATGSYTMLYSFTGGADGGHPGAGVIRDSAGNLFGTTYDGGTGWGVVFKLGVSGHETVLHNFTGPPDGAYPESGVISDSAGNLYGTTEYGGTWNNGVVYELYASGYEMVLYAFVQGGIHPVAGVTRDSAGNLYGTTHLAGAGPGVVYKLNVSGIETTLHSFTGGGDGGNPQAGVIRDAAGNLYGTTLVGGTAGHGVVYKLDPTGKETVLYSFSGGADGGSLSAGVIRDSAGNLYGTTGAGGKKGGGVVFLLKHQ